MSGVYIHIAYNFLGFVLYLNGLSIMQTSPVIFIHSFRINLSVAKGITNYKFLLCEFKRLRYAKSGKQQLYSMKLYVLIFIVHHMRKMHTCIYTCTTHIVHMTSRL